VPLNRTTVRAVAASVAMLTAGGMVAAAAVFHIPVLGFAAADAGASPRHFEQAAVSHTKAKAVTPIRVVKTRVVDEIVHHQSVAASMPASVASAAVAAPAPASVNSTSGTVAPVPSPVAPPPTAPSSGGDDGQQAGGSHGTGHDGSGDGGSDGVSSPGAGQTAGGSQVGQ